MGTHMIEQADEMVEVALPIFCAAARLALFEGDDDHFAAAFEVISRHAMMLATQNPLVQVLLKKCEFPDDNDVIPFVTDHFTAACAGCFFPKSEREAFIIFSDYSNIEAGYLVCKSKEVRYVDRMLLDKKDLELPVFPKYATEQHLQVQLSAIDSNPPEVLFDEGTGDTLKVLFSKDAPNLFTDMQSRASFTILSIDAKGKILRRNLSKVKVFHVESGVLSIQLSGEQQLEVHAAAFNGSWLCVESKDQSIISKIPSLDPDATPELAWVSSTSFGFLGGEAAPKLIQIPKEYAFKLIARHRWFSCTNSDQWFQIALATTEQRSNSKL